VEDGDDVYVAPYVGHKFRKKPDGFFKQILVNLVERRKKIKEELERNFDPLKDVEQQTLKILTNSFYGYTGWSAARWYRRECAEATTAWGRYFITRAVEIAKSMGLEVIYGDTDSLFVKSDGDVVEKARKLSEKVSKEIPLELDVEDLFETIFFTGKKKRYAGLTSEGRIMVRGLEVRRGDWCDLAREVQMKVIETILKEKKVEKAVEYVREIIRELREGKIPLEKLVISKTLVKKPSRYEASQPHVIATIKAKSYGIEYKVGDKVPYIILSGPGGVSERAEPFEALKPEGVKVRTKSGELKEIDIDYYITNQIVPAALRVLEVFGISERELHLASQRTLEDFL
jgi:DNA polymerase I